MDGMRVMRERSLNDCAVVFLNLDAGYAGGLLYCGGQYLRNKNGWVSDRMWVPQDADSATCGERIARLGASLLCHIAVSSATLLSSKTSAKRYPCPVTACIMGRRVIFCPRPLDCDCCVWGQRRAKWGQRSEPTTPQISRITQPDGPTSAKPVMRHGHRPDDGMRRYAVHRRRPAWFTLPLTT